MGLIPGSLVTGQLAAGIALWLCRLGRTDFPIPEMQEFLPEGFRMALQSPGTRCYAANTAFRLSPMSLLRYAANAYWLHGCIRSCTCLTGLRAREIEAEDRYAEIAGIPILQIAGLFLNKCHDIEKRYALSFRLWMYPVFLSSVSCQ